MIDKLTDQSASRRRSVSIAFYFPTLERAETHNTNGRSIITNIIIIITHWTCKDQPWKSVAKPHRPLTAHQHGRQSIRSAGNGRDSGVVLEREVLAPAQRNLGWLENTDESTFPQAEDLYLACPLAFCMFMIRLVFERYVQCHIFILTISTSIIITAEDDVALRASSSADDHDGTGLCSFTLSLNPCMN